MNYVDPAIDDDGPEVNLTSMLDVVFIMLVFFVITASFIRESGVPVSLPVSGEHVPENIETIVVIVEPASTFVVNKRFSLARHGLPTNSSSGSSLALRRPDASYPMAIATAAYRRCP